MTRSIVRRSFLPALLAGITLAAAGGCNHNRVRLGEVPGGPRTRDTLHVQPRVMAATARETVEKKVDAKRAPRTLVASDASWCAVSDEQFAATRVGEHVRCAWIPG